MAPRSRAPSVRLLLGLREAFLLPPTTSRDRSHQRYARNRDVSEAVVAEIVAETVADLTSDRVLGISLELEDDQVESLRRQLTMFMSYLDVMAGMGAPQVPFATLNLAARLAAFSTLTNREPPKRFPDWFDSRDRFVRNLLRDDAATKDLHETSVARAAAKQVAVGKRCLDGVLGGKPIGSEAVLLGIEGILKPHVLESRRATLRADLRLHFAARSVVGLLREAWDDEPTREWLTELLQDWRHMHALFGYLRARAVFGSSKQRDDARLRQILVHGVGCMPLLSPFTWFVHAHPDLPFAKRLNELLMELAQDHFRPPEGRAIARGIVHEMGPTQGAFTLILLGDMNERIEKARNDGSLPPGSDAVWLALREIPRSGTRDELVDAAERLNNLQDEHPDEPRILIRRAIVHHRLGQKQIAKTLANRAAQQGHIVAKAVLERVPHLFEG